MTNEALATAIQDGQTDLMETLWEQNKRLVCGMAIAWKRAFQSRSDFEAEDLMQQGWLALVDAVRLFQPDKEGAAFLPLFRLCLKHQFKMLIGIGTSKRDASFFASISLNSPVDASETDGCTLLELLPDPASDAPFKALEDDSARARMREAMNAAADDALTKRQLKIYHALLMDLSCSDIAKADGLSRKRIWRQKEQILDALRGDSRILQLWLDLTERQETVEDIIDRHISQVGAGVFHESGVSPVERAVMRIIRQEGIIRKKQGELKTALEDKLHGTGKKLMRENNGKRQRQRILSDLTAFENARAKRLEANRRI